MGKNDFLSPKAVGHPQEPQLPTLCLLLQNRGGRQELDAELLCAQIGNRIKSKGLQKLRWYCQMCGKQCRDENGFKCHLSSDSHKRQMMVFGEAPDRVVEGFSEVSIWPGNVRSNDPYMVQSASFLYHGCPLAPWLRCTL